MMAAVLAGLAMSAMPGFGQAKDQSHEICQAHGSRCVLHPSCNLLEYFCSENDSCSQGHCKEADVQKKNK
jgi:hypothetical protein